MAKKREIFKVDEDVLKDMMASESISCGKSGGDVGGNVVSATEKGKNMSEVEKQEKSRKTIRTDPGLEKKVEMYREMFLDKESRYTGNKPISAMICIASWHVSFLF